MINCIWAKQISDTVTECRNAEKSHLHQAAQAFCYRCKWRIPVDKNEPAIVNKLPEARQMRIEEWLRG